MSWHSYDEVVKLLIAYWQGTGPTDLSARNTCRLLADMVIHHLPAELSETIYQDPQSYVTEIRNVLISLGQGDPVAREYLRSLSGTKRTPGQRVSVIGSHNQVITAGRDIRGLNLHVLSTSLGQDTGVMHMERINILAIFANPRDTNPLRLSTEDRAIRECLRRSKVRDYLHLDVRHAATIHDVRRALLDDDYRIVHFSGHGTGKGLALENELGQVRLVPQEALAEFLSAYSPPIECVILNACYSDVQGKMISREVPYTVAMRTAISDEGAIEFTRGFYDAIGAGKSIEFAYEEGCRTIKLMGLPDGDIPVLFKKLD